MNAFKELNEISGEIETHKIVGCCGHCDEEPERVNRATPECPTCGQILCPCCSPEDCPEC